MTSSADYIQDFIIYTEAGTTIEPERKDCDKSGSIMSLLEPHLGRGPHPLRGQLVHEPCII